MAPTHSFAPNVYSTVPVSQTREKKPGQLTDEQVESFFSKGFLVVEKFFSDDELHPAINGISEAVDHWANKLFDAGKIKNKYEEESFYRRLIKIEEQFPGVCVLVMKRGFVPEGIRKLWSNERLLNVVEQFIGPEISGHPIWNLRSKVPSNEQVTVPWHQDNGYLGEGSDGTLVPTAWIPLIDATKDNGCMVVAQGGHRRGKTIKHTCCAGPTWYVACEEEDMVKELGVDLDRDLITCEVPFGGMLLINNLIPHKSLQNYTDQIRWSLDLRWHKTGLNNFFYGLKESVVMRSEVTPVLEIDWDRFQGTEEQHKMEVRRTKERLDEEIEGSCEDDEFDTTMPGPWMLRWEIVHHNRHTDAMVGADNNPVKLKWHQDAS